MALEIIRERVLPEKKLFYGQDTREWLEKTIDGLEHGEDWRKIKFLCSDVQWILNRHLMPCKRETAFKSYEQWAAYCLAYLKAIHNRMFNPPPYKWDGLFKIEIRGPGRPRKYRPLEPPAPKQKDFLVSF